MILEITLKESNGMKLIDKDAVVAEIKRIEYETNYETFTDEVLGKRYVCKSLLSFLDTLEVKKCGTKSGTVQKDLQIILDDGTYIDLDPSMQLKPSFSVKEGERVKVVISKED